MALIDKLKNTGKRILMAGTLVAALATPASAQKPHWETGVMVTPYGISTNLGAHHHNKNGCFNPGVMVTEDGRVMPYIRGHNHMNGHTMNYGFIGELPNQSLQTNQVLVQVPRNHQTVETIPTPQPVRTNQVPTADFNKQLNRSFGDFLGAIGPYRWKILPDSEKRSLQANWYNATDKQREDLFDIYSEPGEFFKGFSDEEQEGYLTFYDFNVNDLTPEQVNQMNTHYGENIPWGIDFRNLAFPERIIIFSREYSIQKGVQK